MRASTNVVTRLGADPDAARLLARSERVCIHFPKVGLVARVHDADAANVAGLALEVAVARYLADHGAPATPPARRLPPGPHLEAGLVLSFWPYIEQRPIADESRREIAAAEAALAQVHEVLAGYVEMLPSWRDDRIGRCGALLRDPARLPALAEPDRRFLLSRYDELTVALDARPIECVPIHGDAHPGTCS